ncbi:MAG: ABC transporter permease [Candidatus Omnitrophota bacterium]|jgi:phospholipid/cholesterol/gamma-HCH transport system permease protein
MLSEKLVFDYSIPKTLLIKISGDWQISAGLLSVNEVTSQLTIHPDIAQINLSISEELKWDSGLISFLLKLIRECELKNIYVAREGLPQEAQKLLMLALKVHEKNIPSHKELESFIERSGERVLQISEGLRSGLDFLGDIAVSFGRLITGKLYFRWDDFLLIVKRCGVDTLLLVSLISLLVGMILAFVGSIQLKMFGAQIFISYIVGIAMVRVLSAVMTGIIMSGRIGASFAAELGMMQANEEIDALKTLGISPVEFLVIPRVLAVVIMMPILTIYADLMGVLGGFVISVGMLNLNPVEYLNRTQHAIKLNYVWVGLIHSFVFGIIVAVAGCLRGIKCERNAAGVGSATTSAVVTGITGIVIATAIITFICQILGV